VQSAPDSGPNSAGGHLYRDHRAMVEPGAAKDARDRRGERGRAAPERGAARNLLPECLRGVSEPDHARKPHRRNHRRKGPDAPPRGHAKRSAGIGHRPNPSPRNRFLRTTGGLTRADVDPECLYRKLNRVLNKRRPQGLPDRKAGTSSACARFVHPGRGHRPGHSATLILVRPGAQSPRPAPVPPPAGASCPPGRALAAVDAGCTGPGGSVPRGRGKRGSRFLIPPKGANPVPGPGRFPGRQAVGLLFQQPVKRWSAGRSSERDPFPVPASRPPPGARTTPPNAPTPGLGRQTPTAFAQTFAPQRAPTLCSPQGFAPALVAQNAQPRKTPSRSLDHAE
jgi:hypothetical protein